MNQNSKASGSRLRDLDKLKELVEAEKIVERGLRRIRYQEKVGEQTFWKERVGSDFNELFGTDFRSFGGEGGFDPNASFLLQPKKKEVVDDSAFLPYKDATAAMARGASKQSASVALALGDHKASKAIKQQWTPLIQQS